MSQLNLPERPDLNYLRDQAKKLLAAYCGGEVDAIDRFRASSPVCGAHPRFTTHNP